MLKVDVLNQEGIKVGEKELNEKIWNVKPVLGLVEEVLRYQMAQARQKLAHTKTRGEVRGGGKKPWRQKGTGRARHGSIRSPLWRGGGIIFGPRKERNFAFKLNQKVLRKALTMCLSDKVLNKNLIVFDSLAPKEEKTKAFADFLKKNQLLGKKILIAFSEAEKPFARFGRNLKNVGIIGARNVNVKDLLKYPYLVLSTQGLAEIEKVFK